MTALRSHRFKTRLYIKTTTNYIFSEGLLNEDYHAILNERKKINALKNDIAVVLQKYMACNIQFPCSRK